jgi:methionine aminopeptidase
MAILIKSEAEIEKMRISGIALRKVHDAVKALYALARQRWILSARPSQR